MPKLPVKQSVKFANPESNLAVCTLWTPLEIVERHLSEDDYAIIGQLYSKDAGLNTVLRYCLSNKRIRYIVVCGQDRTGSGQALINLKEKGIDAESRVIGVPGAAVDKEIPKDAVERFRKNVEILDFRNETHYSRLKDEIKRLPKLESYGTPEEFPEAKVELPESFPTDPLFKIRAKTVGEAWLQALSAVMTYGSVKQSQHDERQKEVICLSATITDENTAKPEWKNYYPFQIEELEDYYPQVLSDQKIPELTYTYGQRLRDHKGVDQIMEMVRKLKETPYTRRAVAATWNVERDTNNKNPPCLCFIEALVTEGKLYLIAFVRSLDVYGAFVKNAYALRRLQETIAGETGNKVGDLTLIYGSGHIYERHFRIVNELLKDCPLKENIKFDLPRSTGNLDPRGNIHIEISKGRLKLTHLAPDGTRLEEFTAATAAEAVQWLVLGQKIGDISHAIYVGQELAKAELAMRKGLKYQQDMPLG
ncbi:hypothetical protein HYY74_00935 [Candidatus Woesearchaeota archaeon]|nr:hypothetical protein [Candidatus Woesearchaeota archaeon]